MSDFWKELFNRLPDWFFSVTAGLILLTLAVVLIWFILGAKRFSDAMGRENRLAILQDEISKERDKSRESSEIASQISRALENAQVYLNQLNRLKRVQEHELLAEVHNLFQRLVEALASDVKYRPGERHRCGLWIESGGELILLHASAGFPDHYLRNRRLDIERSIAGKSFRRGQTIVLDNVRENDDWEPNPESSSPYLALICIPIGRWGVLTVDALHPMKEHVKMICELYGCMIEGAMEEYMRLLSVTEIAASKPEKKQA